MHFKARPTGLLPAVDWRNPITRGLVFCWAPGTPLFDWVKGIPITRGSAVTNNFSRQGRTVTGGSWGNPANYLTFPNPISSGSASMFAVAELFTITGAGTPMSAGNNTSYGEFLAFGGDKIYMSAFNSAAAYWLGPVVHTQDLTKPFTYSVSVNSGVSGGARMWLNKFYAGAGTVTASHPTTLGIIGPSSNTFTGLEFHGRIYLAALWNRALSDDEMRDLQDEPWQIAQTAKSSVGWAPMFSAPAAPSIVLNAMGGPLRPRSFVL